ncbi:MAG: GntR family transcriptional regulator [Chitinivibrionales bacterium]|nr:GntR family transcriptional regulator [Chitinivibrionales bacterium]
MSDKYTPALDKAIEFLHARYGEPDSGFTGKRSSLRALAHEAGVSLVTMWKASQALQERYGDIKDISADRELVNAGPAHDKTATGLPPVDLPSYQPLWRDIADRLAQDILRGTYPPGEPLPSLKELQHTYQTSYPTVRKALAHCVNQNILEPAHRGYAVPSYHVRQSGMSIVVSGVGTSPGKIDTGSHFNALMQLLEVHCADARINLKVQSFTCDKETGSVRFNDPESDDPTRLYNTGSILGYVYLLVNPESFSKKLLAQLARVKKPVAIVDDLGMIDYYDLRAKSKFIKVFTITNTTGPAEQVARYLLELGHSRIAYITPLFKKKHIWSFKRLQGLRQVYASAGNPDNVVLIQSRGFYKTIALKKAKIDRLTKSYKQWKKTIPEEYSEDFDRAFSDFIKTPPWQAEVRNALKPLFAQALNDRSITAWVCVNDQIALFALEFLEKNGLAASKDISIISFDDTFEAFRSNLTSYNFNIPNLIHLIMGYIVRGQTPAGVRKTIPLDTAGTIVERASTSTAHRLKS